MRVVVLDIVILRKDFTEARFDLDGIIGIPSRSHRVTYLSLFGNVQKDANLIKDIYSTMRTLLVSISRYPKMFIPFRFISLKVEFRVPDLPKIMNLTVFRAGIKIPTFTMREAASIGIRIPELDFSHEYELRKNIYFYEIFVMKGISISENSELQDINTFYNKPNINSTQSTCSLAIKGFDSNPDHWIPIHGHGNWRYLEIPDAQLLHGRVIISDGIFFFTDTSRIPRFNSTNVWPYLIRQTSDGKFETPAPISSLVAEDEAIFIGGTNNFMHFVLEDLPRLVLADKMGISRLVPIILRSGLSKQILETISAISGRRQIYVDSFEDIFVRRLHAFQFTNLLPEVMSGSLTAADKLIDRELLALARQSIESPTSSNHINRVLIVREKGLFRPLTNSKRIRNELIGMFGFEIAELGDSNFIKSRSIFFNAQIVVGEYGAGLANMIFAKGPTTIIEIRGPLEKDALEYRALSDACGFQHTVLIGKARKISKYGIARGPFRISVKLLKNSINSDGGSFL